MPPVRWRGRSSSRRLIIIAAYLPLFAFQRDRGEAVLSDGLCRRLCAAGRADRLHCSWSRASRISAYRKPRRVFRNPVLGWLEAGYRDALAGLAAAARHRLSAELPPRPWPWSCSALTVWREFLPEARRGLDLAPRRDASRNFAAEGDRDGRRAARRHARISGSDDGRDPYRAQRRRHRSVDALAHGSGRRARAPTARGRQARPSRI